MTPFRSSGATSKPAFDLIYLDLSASNSYNARNESSGVNRGTQYYYCSNGLDASLALEMRAIGERPDMARYGPFLLFRGEVTKRNALRK